MPETPQEMAARADRILAKCRDRRQASLADVQNLVNAIHQVADEYDSLLDAAAEQNVQLSRLNDEFGILDDGKPMEIDGKSQVLLLNSDQVRVALEIRAKDVFAAESRRPARLMQRLVTGWREIPGDGARGEDEGAHTRDNCSGIDPDTCLYNGETEA